MWTCVSLGAISVMGLEVKAAAVAAATPKARSVGRAHHDEKILATREVDWQRRKGLVNFLFDLGCNLLGPIVKTGR